MGAMTGAIVATSIVFFPAAPLFLFIHGKDITIPQGTEITAFIEGDMHLNMERFSVAAPTQPVPAPAISAQANLVIESTPSGADIEVDGRICRQHTIQRDGCARQPSNCSQETGLYRLDQKPSTSPVAMFI